MQNRLVFQLGPRARHLQSLSRKLRQMTANLDYIQGGGEICFAVDPAELIAYLRPRAPGLLTGPVLPGDCKPGSHVYAQASDRCHLARTYLFNNSRHPAFLLPPHFAKLERYLLYVLKRDAALAQEANTAWRDMPNSEKVLLRKLHAGRNLSESEARKLLTLIRGNFSEICRNVAECIYPSSFRHAVDSLDRLVVNGKLYFYGVEGDAGIFENIHIKPDEVLNDEFDMFSRYIRRRSSDLNYEKARALALLFKLNRSLLGTKQRAVMVSNNAVYRLKEIPDTAQYTCDLESFFLLMLATVAPEDTMSWIGQLHAEVTSVAEAIDGIVKGSAPVATKSITKALAAVDRGWSDLINQRLAIVLKEERWLVEELSSRHRQIGIGGANAEDERMTLMLRFVEFVLSDEKFRGAVRRDEGSSWGAFGDAVDQLRRQGRWSVGLPRCFISYSREDEAFVQLLRAHLEARGVSCWFAPSEVRARAYFAQEIEDAIRMHDRVVVVLSKSALRSNWVQREVAAGFEQEEKRGKSMLVPIRLDDAIKRTRYAWAADIRRRRQIADFSAWESPDKFEAAMERLVEDLSREESFA